jgi:hypothetical protein
MLRALMTTSVLCGFCVVLERPVAHGEAPTNSLKAESTSTEVLARGPIHEAFAEPVNLSAVDPVAFDAAPPKSIEELPPTQIPEGDNVQWIPGYWAWDDDRTDFIWISGVWRECPPGQRWVPGYWSEGEHRWSWTPGFWISDTVREVQYLPEPPETVEAGPNVDAPSENHIWIPGVWRYVDTRYVWQPGYWTVGQPDWLWVPAHYAWSPSGYVFIDGYWDYPLVQRGVLFAPVYYREPVFQQADYHYTPTTVISTDLLTLHFFSRPRYCHYYFGDYYASRYREIGIEPWLMAPRLRGVYDPIFTYYSWDSRRSGRDWYETARDHYDFFSRNERYRPAATFAALRRQRFDPTQINDATFQQIVTQQNNLLVNFNQYVKNAEQVISGPGGRRESVRFAGLGEDERQSYLRRADSLREFQRRRRDVERIGRNITDRRSEGRRDPVVPRDDRIGRALRLDDLPDSVAVGPEGIHRRANGRGLPPRPDQAAGTTDSAGASSAAVRTAERSQSSRGSELTRADARDGKPPAGPGFPEQNGQPEHRGVTRNNAIEPRAESPRERSLLQDRANDNADRGPVNARAGSSGRNIESGPRGPARQADGGRATTRFGPARTQGSDSRELDNPLNRNAPPANVARPNAGQNRAVFDERENRAPDRSRTGERNAAPSTGQSPIEAQGDSRRLSPFTPEQAPSERKGVADGTRQLNLRPPSSDQRGSTTPGGRTNEPSQKSRGNRGSQDDSARSRGQLPSSVQQRDRSQSVVPRTANRFPTSGSRESSVRGQGLGQSFRRSDSEYRPSNDPSRGNSVDPRARRSTEGFQTPSSRSAPNDARPRPSTSRSAAAGPPSRSNRDARPQQDGGSRATQDRRSSRDDDRERGRD